MDLTSRPPRTSRPGRPGSARYGPLPLAILIFFGLAAALTVPGTLGAQSRTDASRAASALLADGSELTVAGSVEILHGGAELLVASARPVGRGLELVLVPVAEATSRGAEASRQIVVEVAEQVWQHARASAASGLHASSHAAAGGSQVVRIVALGTLDASQASVETSAAVAIESSALGYALVHHGVVLGIVPLERLEELLGHRVHP